MMFNIFSSLKRGIIKFLVYSVSWANPDANVAVWKGIAHKIFLTLMFIPFFEWLTLGSRELMMLKS